MGCGKLGHEQRSKRFSNDDRNGMCRRDKQGVIKDIKGTRLKEQQGAAESEERGGSAEDREERGGRRE